MLTKFVVVALAATSCMLGSSAAMAAYVTDYSNGLLLGSWNQDLTPIPLSLIAGQDTEIAITNGTGAASGVSSAFWYNILTQGGGLLVGDPGGTILDPIGSPINTTGPQSYTGSESAPVFMTGVYHEDDGSIVTISVPEPATWAMMLVGLGMVGFVARWRRNLVVTYG